MSQSLYRNLFGEEYRYKYHHMDLCRANTDGNKMAINNKFMALTWNYDRGGIAIFDPNEYSYGKPDQKLIKGHTGKIFDIKFSPFRTDLLASASEDCTVKLWQIPKEGLTQDLKTDAQTYLGHKRKVCLVDFNKSAADVVASASVDNTLQVWNMIKAESYATCQINGNPTSLEWDYNGNLVACSDSERNITVFDPRGNNVIWSQKVSDGRMAKFVWSGEYTLAYVGINKKNEREFKNFDLRNINENKESNEVFTVKIDEQVNIITPFFDRESKLLYCVGKGEANVNAYDFNETTPRRCLNFPTNNAASSFVMIDRKNVDFNKNEVDKMAKWTVNNEIYYVSFYVMRREVKYDPQLFPYIPVSEPSMNFEQWKAGENIPVQKKEITEFDKNEFITRDDKFEKREKFVAEITPGEKYKNLQNKLIELEHGIQKIGATNLTLKKKIEEEMQDIERLENKVKEVMAEVEA